MRNFIIITIFASLIACQTNTKDQKIDPPNIVIIFTDDQGYEDVGVYGAEEFKTPHLDQMASEGLRFTNFYVGSSVCSPSRASLLTGCYPSRIGVNFVFAPKGPPWTLDKYMLGLNPAEETIAEVLKKEGYETACIGKWHLGHDKKFMPLNHGFDYFYGIPYSNDMIPATDSLYPDLPLMVNDSVIEYNPDQNYFTKNFTDKAIEFIKRNKKDHFFLYLAHPMPHVPLFRSEAFKGKSTNSVYGDVIEEIDWSVGRINATLKELGIAENTIVMFASDNGPWVVKGDDAGSAGILREGKMTVFEGGFRVPFIVKWPKHIQKNVVSNQIMTAMDVFPTITSLAADTVQKERKIDGIDFSKALTTKNIDSVIRNEFLYFHNGKALAIRKGKWKLILPHDFRSQRLDSADRYLEITENIDLALFDLDNDPGEQVNLAENNPEVVKNLRQLLEEKETSILSQARPVGRID
jgi:arylsulfatase